MHETEAITAAIATNVRGQRTHRGLTLDALAQRAGVSKGMLVQIEQGRTNPSVSTLTRIAAALGTTVAKLVEVYDVPPVRVIAKSEVMTFTHAGSVAKLLVGADSPMILELWDWRLDPGAHHDGDAHPPGTREMLTVLDGELTLTVHGRTHTITEGDALLFTADRPHRYANTGSQPLRFTMVVVEPKEVAES
ncbi:helix-turn-helix domain-containing protein [Nonomuraea sp. NPDC050328]|uniref:helix-turn-helix domain-containing protein n=1 Tax=Nonomuraea sp. NPDC050328 TaxID=3364361 RepID=UPI00378FAF59